MLSLFLFVPLFWTLNLLIKKTRPGGCVHIAMTINEEFRGVGGVTFAYLVVYYAFMFLQMKTRSAAWARADAEGPQPTIRNLKISQPAACNA